ncbi:winged helix-turn-helix domain-containing tetratricopeptide repeat protein [Devosia equisanguinis]|nr:winged helix-turn-helix domain-containing protein [Devosia equisanguinis]
MQELFRVGCFGSFERVENFRKLAMLGAMGTTLGPFTLDHERRQLMRDGRTLALGQRGYVLFETLAEAGGAAVSKDTLMERAWPGLVVEESNLSVQISALRRALGADGDSIVITVPRIGYRLVVRPPSSETLRGPPLIAVLPVLNQGSGDEENDFSDGTVDDVITALSRFKTFAVLSRSASFALRDRGSNAATAARELGVRYILEVGVRRRADRLRVTAQLLSADVGAALFAESYDGSASEVFAFQDRITQAVVGVIEPAIRTAEIERVRRKPPESLDAYDLFLKALPMVYAPTPQRHEEALALLQKSAELDPSFGLPLAYAAWIYEKRISARLPSLGNSDHDNCIALAHAALKVGRSDPIVRAICSFVLYRLERNAAMLEGLREAVRENPNNVVILNLSGIGHQMSGDADEALRCRRRAYELSPSAPDAYVSLHGMGAAEMMRGNLETAVQWCLRSLATFNEWPFTYMTLATCYERLGRMDDARAMVRRLRELNPTLTLTALEEGVDRCDDAYGLAVIPSLRAAGLPER